MAWAFDRIPDLAGRVALVTGANSGIGFKPQVLSLDIGPRRLWRAAISIRPPRLSRVSKRKFREAKLDSLSLNLADLNAVTMGAATHARTFTRLRGSPEVLRIPARALNPATADRLGSVSEALTGVSIPLPAGLAGDAANA